MADSGHRHVAEFCFSGLFPKLQSDFNAGLSCQLHVQTVRCRSDRKRFAQCFRMVSVAERSHDNEPFPCRDIGGKGAVFIRTDVEPNVFSFVVEQEVVGNSFGRGVHQRTVDKVRVLEWNLNRLIDRIKTDSESVKDDFAHQVVIGGVFIISRGSIEQNIVSTGRQRHGDDTGLGVVLGGEIQALTVIVDGLQGEVWSGHGAVLERAVFCSVQVDVHNDINSVRVRNQFHDGQIGGFRMIHDDAIGTAHVQAFIHNGKVPGAVGQVKHKFTLFVGRGLPHEAILIGGHNFRSFPGRQGSVPTTGVLVKIDNTVHRGCGFKIQRTKVNIIASLDRNKLTQTSINDDALCGHVVREAGRNTNREETRDVGHG